MKYIALTIGPIYKTLQNAKSTREIWGASYFFSYVMKKIIEKLIDRGINEEEFITPFVDKEKLNLKNGVGLFHDRMIFKSDKLNKENFEKLVNEVLKNIEKNSNNYLNYEFLKNYLQIHIIELDKKFKNPILDISPYLDSAELMFQAQLNSENRLLQFIKDRLRGSFLAQDAYGKNKISFPSLPKIALNSFVKEIDENVDEQKFMDNLITKYSKEIKPYNKYIAIVQADGDNMGAILEKIGDKKEELKNFSKALFEFCENATQDVENFNGKMIYAGGDDLLFFAPIANDKKTIFELLDEISNDFNKKIENIVSDLKLEKKPSISFGLSITYYKFPLQEARDNAVNLLFNKAKNEPKNQIAYQVIKHSGQTFESIINKDNLFNDFLNVIKFDDTNDANFLHSIYTKIDKYKIVLNSMINICENEECIKKKLEAFFKNNFNEQEHKKYDKFFKDLINFITKVYSSNKDEKFEFIYSTLRLKKFLLGDKK